jgi:hypothetical protein
MKSSVSRLLLVVIVLTIVGALGVVFALRLTRGTYTESIEAGVRTIRVGPRDDLQAALNAAQYGDVIVLDAKPDVVYKGNFLLPKKSGTGEIVIQSSRANELPEGKRVSPKQADPKSPLFAKLQTTNDQPVVRTDPGAHHYRFVGIEFSTADDKVMVYDLVRLGDTRHQQKTLDSVPHNIIIDRCYIHGLPAQDVQRGVSLNSKDTTISNSHISDVHGVGYDSQAIGGWNGPGPFKITNNHLEAAGENIMFGGADPAAPEFIPANITITGNYLFKPRSWNVGDPSYAGKHWTVKNLFELKNAKTVVVDGNYFENNWTDGQAGIPILFTVRNQEGSAPWSVVHDVIFKNNIVKGADGGGLNFLGNDNEKPSAQASKAVVENNLFVDIRGIFLTMNGFHNVSITHNTHIQTGNIMILYGKVANGFDYSDNLTIRGPKGYGVFGDATGEGAVALRKYTPDAIFKNNVLAGADSSIYPKDNFYPSPDKVGFVDLAQKNYRLSPTSSFRKSASDGTPVGCDWDKLNFNAKTID